MPVHGCSIALYGLKRYADARTALLEASRLSPEDKLPSTWLKKPEIVALEAPPPPAKPATIRCVLSRAALERGASPVGTDRVRGVNGVLRHEWFQSDSAVVVSVFIKNVKPADATIEFGQQSVRPSPNPTPRPRSPGPGRARADQGHGASCPQSHS